MNENITKIKSYVEIKLSQNTDGHGIDHINRVVSNLELLLKNDNDNSLDLELCYITAYTHDLLDHKLFENLDLEQQQLELFLKSLNYEDKYIKNIIFNITNLGFSKKYKFSQKEAMLVQDADRIDALGAHGIARTFIYGSQNNHSYYYDQNAPNTSVIGHFYVKLYLLADLMNTDYARDIAQQRITFMKKFEQQLMDELNGIK